MKKWWLDTGYPWLKENWWVVLLSPFLLLVMVSVIIHDRFSSVGVKDPLREADARAREEAEARARLLEEEKQRLEAELADIRQKYAELQTQLEARLTEGVDELRNDPEKLRQAMLAAGKGR